MARVLGIKAVEPKGLADWYARVLGFEIADWGGVSFPPLDRGVTVWSPFEADATYFDPSPHAFMINLVVDDLDGVLARAKAEGVEPLGREEGPQGRFAWILDPAGIKIELWEPKKAEAAAAG
jgi:catechol 2,3-dioxygenase-like lactoylglutathione lyase family enzyme